MPVVAIAFTPAPPEQSPNLRRAKHSNPTHTYYLSMLVTFSSVLRWREGFRLVLVSDEAIPAEFGPAFADLGVEQLQVAYDHRPPADFTETFSASLYTLDAMRALAAEFPDEKLVLIDPDCLAMRPLRALAERASDRIAAYPTGFPHSEVANGLSGYTAGELHTQLNPELVGPAAHYGGECYGFTADIITPILAKAEEAYAFALKQHEQGKAKFTTEEHVLNYALRTAAVDPIDDLVRRIWTAAVYRNVRGDERGLTLWHLPSEKDRAFVRLGAPAKDPNSWFWSAPAEEYRARVGRLVGVPKRSVSRLAYDSAGRTVRRLQRRVK